MQDFFLPVAVLPQWGLSMKVVQLLGLQGPWRCQVCRDTDYLCRKSYGPIWVFFFFFFWVSCSWWSEGLFGQSFSIVLPIQVMVLVFWILSFKPAFSLYSFTLIKRLFSSSSLSALRVVSSAYLRLLIFLQTILIPACTSSSLAFLMMYSAYKLNKQGDNIQP